MPAIRVQNLSKLYKLGSHRQGYYRTLRESLTDATSAPFRRLFSRNGHAQPATLNPQRPSDSLWALHDVSFDVQPGEVVGIIGRNGAGKSTLLKILSRITEPTSGRVELHGRVGSLLEVGTGFHPELTGRENIFMNGSILGMSRREIARKFDEIVAFAEIEKFLDTPVKRYSSGMFVRLAFAVAAHLEPEILVVDEVLAVGDVEFQRKCLGKMQEVGRVGRTVLFVSHNISALQMLCKRGVVLSSGGLVLDAPIDQAIAAYLKSFGQSASAELSERKDRKGVGGARIQKVEIVGDLDGTDGVVTVGRPARFVFHLDRHLPGLRCAFSILDQHGHPMARFNSWFANDEDTELGGDSTPQMVCEVDEWLLAPGRYRVDVSINTSSETHDAVESAAVFDVECGPVRGRECPRATNDWKLAMPHRWLVLTD